eukprot:jgi/Psemu1/45756/gm1.45756_g
MGKAATTPMMGAATDSPRHRNQGTKGANNGVSTFGGVGSNPQFQGQDQTDMKGVVIDHSIDHGTPYIHKKEMYRCLWLEEKKERSKGRKEYKSALKKLFVIMYGQLSTGITERLKVKPDWKTIIDDADALKLIKHLKEVCYQDNESSMSPPVDVITKIKQEVRQRLLGCIQRPNTVFGRADMIRDETCVSFTGLLNLCNHERRSKTDSPGWHQAIACGYKNCGGLKQKNHRNIPGMLRDEFALKKDAYATTPSKALKLLRTNGANNTNETQGDNNKNNGEKTTKSTVFVTNGEVSQNDVQEAHQLLMNGIADGETFGDELCFVQIGQTKEHARNPRSGALTHTDQVSHETEFLLAQNNERLDPHLLLLDSQATCNVISNCNLLHCIRPHPNGDKVDIHCNAGSVATTMVGELPGFGAVWFLEKGIANILSLGLVSDQYRVTLDMSVSQSFYVHKPDGSTRQFTRAANNLYVCNLQEQHESLFAITTDKGKTEFYSNLDIWRADRARRLQETIGFPSTKEFLQMIDNNWIQNCGVTHRDIHIAEDIYGINTSIIKGKTVRRQPQHMQEDLFPIPPGILKHYQDITLGVDKGTLMGCIQAVIGLYTKRGFIVTQLVGDNEFACVQDDLLQLQPPITINYSAHNEHEPFIKQDNQTSKERCHCTFAAIPSTRMPPRQWYLGAISARKIITGDKLHANCHCKFQFGD